MPTFDIWHLSIARLISSVQMRRVYINHTFTFINVDYISKNQNYMKTVDTGWINLSRAAHELEVFCLVSICHNQRAQGRERGQKKTERGRERQNERKRARKTPAWLAGKPTPNPLLFSHKPHRSFTRNLSHKFHTFQQIAFLTSALHVHFCFTYFFSPFYLLL